MKHEEENMGIKNVKPKIVILMVTVMLIGLSLACGDDGGGSNGNKRATPVEMPTMRNPTVVYEPTPGSWDN